MSTCNAEVITVNDHAVYGVLVLADERGFRFLVAEREWETLGHHAGATLRVRLPGRAERAYLLTAATPVADTGNAWLCFGEPVAGPLGGGRGGFEAPRPLVRRR